MHRPLAEALAARGNRVITLDLLGHGRSDRPRDMWHYSMPIYGRQVVALLDHLEIAQTAVMGTSLGANTALEVAASSPERLRGLVIEMPVLDNGLLGSALAFTPLLVALTFGEPAMKLLARATRMVPRRLLPHYGNVMLDTVRQEPGPSGALLQGLLFGRTAPPRSERRTFTTPTLVLGHQRDPVHPFSDAGMLAGEMAEREPDRSQLAARAADAAGAPDQRDPDVLDQVWSRKARTTRASRTSTARAKRPASAPSASGREQFQFVDADVPGRFRGRARRGLADPQRHERNAFVESRSGIRWRRFLTTRSGSAASTPGR